MGNPVVFEDIGTTYTTVDISSTGTTTVYDPSVDATVYLVVTPNEGISTAEIDLRITDGNNTSSLDDPGAGTGVDFRETFVMPASDQLEIQVETAGSGELTCVVSHGEQVK